MTRPATWLLLLLLLSTLSGCGEPDRPRFVPATGEARESSPAPRPTSGATTIPKNIPMH